MKKSTDNSKNTTKKNDEGYPLYPPEDDIYSEFKEEQDIDPEDITSKKPYKNPKNKDFEDDPLFEDEDSSDLDIPGSELDDDMEDIGSEDEENNYYSLGGDNHNDLEEDQG